MDAFSNSFKRNPKQRDKAVNNGSTVTSNGCASQNQIVRTEKDLEILYRTIDILIVRYRSQDVC